MEIYVARQPIFNKNKKIYAYELLFRAGMSNFFPDIDGITVGVSGYGTAEGTHAVTPYDDPGTGTLLADPPHHPGNGR